MSIAGHGLADHKAVQQIVQQELAGVKKNTDSIELNTEQIDQIKQALASDYYERLVIDQKDQQVLASAQEQADNAETEANTFASAQDLLLKTQLESTIDTRLQDYSTTVQIESKDAVVLQSAKDHALAQDQIIYDAAVADTDVKLANYLTSAETISTYRPILDSYSRAEVNSLIPTVEPDIIKTFSSDDTSQLNYVATAGSSVTASVVNVADTSKVNYHQLTPASWFLGIQGTDLIKADAQGVKVYENPLTLAVSDVQAAITDDAHMTTKGYVDWKVADAVAMVPTADSTRIAYVHDPATDGLSSYVECTPDGSIQLQTQSSSGNHFNRLSVYDTKISLFKSLHFDTSFEPELNRLIVGCRGIELDSAVSAAVADYGDNHLMPKKAISPYIDSKISGLKADRIQSVSAQTACIANDTSLGVTVEGVSVASFSKNSVSSTQPILYSGPDPTLANQLVTKAYVDANAGGSNTSSLYSVTLETLAADSRYQVSHNLGQELEDLIIEVTGEAKVDITNVPAKAGDKFKVHWENYNGSTSQKSYGLYIASSSQFPGTTANSFYLVTHDAASITANVSSSDTTYNSVPWTSVKLHVRVSSLMAPTQVTQYQVTDISVDTIANSNGDALTMSPAGTLYCSIPNVDLRLNDWSSQFAITFEPTATTTNSTFKIRSNIGATLTDDFVFTPSKSGKLAGASDKCKLNLNYFNSLTAEFLPGTPVFESDYNQNFFRFHTDVYCENLFTSAPSSREYKEYSYLRDWEKRDDVPVAKKDEPGNPAGFQTFYSDTRDLPRVCKYKYKDAFVRALGKTEAYAASQADKYGWIWEDVVSVFPSAASQITATNKETGIEYQQKKLDAGLVQMMLVDCLIEKVQRLENAMEEYWGVQKKRKW